MKDIEFIKWMPLSAEERMIVSARKTITVWLKYIQGRYRDEHGDWMMHYKRVGHIPNFQRDVV